jgi:uncharacterized protein with GYD domain
MATYIVLGSFTDQGVKNVQKSPERARAFQAQAAQAGVQIRGIYWTMGPYDFVVISEAPDEEALTAGLLKLAGHGNVRTQTMRAFDVEAMERIIARMGS